MKYALWVVQVLVAVAFFGSGLVKIITPRADLIAQTPYVEAFPHLFIQFIGLAEILAAVGVILPIALRIQPQLTPLAAAGLCIIMIGAAITHLVRGEYGNIVLNLILFALAAFVAYGRWRMLPVAPRGEAATA